jgi:hypothetical protein
MESLHVNEKTTEKSATPWLPPANHDDDFDFVPRRKLHSLMLRPHDDILVPLDGIRGRAQVTRLLAQPHQAGNRGAFGN